MNNGCFGGQKQWQMQMIHHSCRRGFVVAWWHACKLHFKMSLSLSPNGQHICWFLHLKMFVHAFVSVYSYKSKHIPTCWKLGSASGDPGSGTDPGLVARGLINNAESLSSVHTDWLTKTLHLDEVSGWLMCMVRFGKHYARVWHGTRRGKHCHKHDPPQEKSLFNTNCIKPTDSPGTLNSWLSIWCLLGCCGSREINEEALVNTVTSLDLGSLVSELQKVRRWNRGGWGPKLMRPALYSSVNIPFPPKPVIK